jgi:Ala-tRNA(Pro) deacylase
MTISRVVQDVCAQSGVDYDILSHPRAPSSQRAAQSAHVPGDRVAKSVVLDDEWGHVMAVVPATHQIDTGVLNALMGRDLYLTPEHEFADLFDDCDVGAIPPFGGAYRVLTVTDISILRQPEVYFEAGDHEHLVHVRGRDFRRLMEATGQGWFSYHT